MTTTADTLPQTIETPRLRLRLPTLDDATPLVQRWASDPACTRYVLFATYAPDDRALAEQFLGMCVGNWAAGKGHRPWVICERDGDDVPIGMIGITPSQGPHSWEVGYIVGRAWWGRGFVTEAVHAVVNRLFDDPRVWRVFAPTHIDNAASQRVLAKAGFTREATLRRAFVFTNLASEPQDCSLWAITRDDRLRTAAV
jgi:RimJ/RimL family protein N-acetyltransferase